MEREEEIRTITTVFPRTLKYTQKALFFLSNSNPLYMPALTTFQVENNSFFNDNSTMH